MNSKYDVWCVDGVFHIDAQNLLNPEMMGAYQEMELEVNSSSIQIPNSLSPGMDLPDAYVEVKVSSAGINMMTMRVNQTNRKVVGKEKVQTPAGTFDTYKISYDLDMKTGFVNTDLSSVDYFAPGVGAVKSESYRKGKLMSYTLMTQKNF